MNALHEMYSFSIITRYVQLQILARLFLFDNEQLYRFLRMTQIHSQVMCKNILIQR